MLDVVVTAYRRPVYLRQVLDSWSRARGVDRVRFTFHVEPSDRKVQVLDAIKRSGLANVEVVANRERLGVLTNPWSALDQAFQRGAGFAVLAEDDLLVSTDVVEFLEWAAAEFEQDRETLVVSAHSTLGGIPTGDVVKDQAFAGQVWGTWADRWTSALSPTWDHDYSTGVNGEQAGWDWNIGLRVIPAAGAAQVRPVVSRSQHIGRLDGAHMVPEQFDQSVVPSWWQQVDEPLTYALIGGN